MKVFDSSLVTLSMEELNDLEMLIEQHEDYWNEQVVFEIGIGELLNIELEDF